MDLKEQFYGTEIEMTGITRMHACLLYTSDAADDRR